jgi:hypothetical protein
MCRLQTFTNVSRIVVLKCTGDALCEECYTRFVQPDGACDCGAGLRGMGLSTHLLAGVYDGHKVRAKDVVRLERGGTGFAATSKVEASSYSLLGVGSGLADRRGQLANGRSKFAGMRL